MRRVAAPDGYEGSVHWDDGGRCWRPSYRRVGDTYWTLTFRDAGHAYLTEAEVTARAESAILDAIRIRAPESEGEDRRDAASIVAVQS